MKIHFGALADPLSKQLKGYVDEKHLDNLDKINDSIERLRFAFSLPDSIVDNLRKKLLKKIEEYNKENNQ